VVVALGHTAAAGARIRDAVQAGARLSTHLGNGCHAVLPRHDNPIWEQLAADELWASVICDGWHLTPAVARCMLRVKTAARAVLTCDASSLAGLPPGRYEEWGETFEVQTDGKVVVPGTSYLAGSGVFTDTCIGWAVRHAGVSLREAIDMASVRPRELLGLSAGLTDLLVFEYEPGGELRVTATMPAA
jgi:N-acetylglucosamine-6-phosphate deacetylase